MPNHQLLRPLTHHPHKPLINTSLDIDPIRRDASLARMPPLQRHQLRQRLLEIGVLEHDERTIPTQLQRHFLQSRSAMRRDNLTHPRAPREGNLLDERVLTQRLAQAGRILQTRRQHVEHSWRKPRFLSQICERQARQRRLRRRLDNHRTPRRERRARLAQHHRDGEVPRHERESYADGLLDNEGASVGRGGREDAALDAVRFAGEEPGEACGVVDLGVGFREGFAGFVGEDLGDIGAVVED